MSGTYTSTLLQILGKVAVVLFSVFVLYQVFSTSPSWTVLDYANLIFHEAGHFIAFFLGQFVQVLSGSLMQILVPIIVIINFYRSRQYFSIGFAIFWLGESTHYLSIYIGDASTMALPLLGGDSSIHDWNYLLTTTNLLQYDHVISLLVRSIAITEMLTGLIWMVWNVLWTHKNN